MADSEIKGSSLPDGYSLHSGYPSVSEYCNLRAVSGLSPRNEVQAAGAVRGSWYGCYVKHTAASSGEATVVGMGRVISDGSWYFIIADMAVLPEHQRRGLGDVVLKHLLAYIKEHAAEGEIYVSLSADPPGMKLYKKNHFRESSELHETGMVLLIDKKANGAP